MSKEDLAYIAGLFDGEGCISIDGELKLRVCIMNTNSDIIYWVKEIFGGHTYLKPKNQAQNKDNYEWKVTGNKAVKVIRTLFPYLRIKKEEAIIALRFGKTLKPLGQQYRPIPPHIRLERIWLRNSLKLLRKPIIKTGFMPKKLGID